MAPNPDALSVDQFLFANAPQIAVDFNFWFSDLILLQSATMSHQPHPQTKVISTQVLPPDPEGSAEIYSRLGYTLSQAVADLVDNSIDAGAKNILIRFEKTDVDIRRVLIIDDGRGISSDGIEKAMTIGAHTGKTTTALGKYGVGLKSASFSQAASFKVFSLTASGVVARRWSLVNMKKGWLCEVLASDQLRPYLTAQRGPFKLDRQGTVIVWEELAHLKAPPSKIDQTLARAIRAIQVDTGMRFHRFIESGRTRIFIDAHQIGDVESGVHVEVRPLDPFGYPISGSPEYPKEYLVELPQFGTLPVRAHVWPPKSSDPNYKLGGGKVASRQGFYFYRNDRLIQAGGWNGCRDDDGEPHLSLARVQVELPPKFDAAFQLDVAKSLVVPPPEFPGAVSNAVSSDKREFKDFVATAQSVYRERKSLDGGVFKHRPGNGFPAPLRKAVEKALWDKRSAKLEPVNFKWVKLPPTVLVEIDREEQTLCLNSIYRTQLLEGKSASSADLPLLKLLMLFLFQEELDRKASSEKYRVWLERINQSLIQVLEFQS